MRGTIAIIRQQFNDPEFLVTSNFQNNDQFHKQASRENDDAVAHKKTCRAYSRFTPVWFCQSVSRRLAPSLWGRMVYKEMVPYFKNSSAILSIGGDNYSLDYSSLDLFVQLDLLTLKHKKPIIIWGASVGPFTKIPHYEKFMADHLKKITAIFVRERASLEYLRSLGVRENVCLVADPAFCLQPSQPEMDSPLDEDGIGVNLSPMMARYVTDGDQKKWVALSAKIIRIISQRTKRTIYLIPHVTSPHSSDYCFLKEVSSLLDGYSVVLLPDKYNAAETKWIISKMVAFVGARTHSTIAAMSSCVPTLSLIYSVKGFGINRDIFGHSDYCVDASKCDADIMADKIVCLLNERKQIEGQLTETIPTMQALAFSSGKHLKEILER